MLPFLLKFEDTASTCIDEPMMAYESDINIWNNGRMDAWNTARDPGFGMA